MQSLEYDGGDLLGDGGDFLGNGGNLLGEGGDHLGIVNTVSSPPQAKQHVAPRAATRSLQIPSSTSLPLVKLGQNRYEPPASMFANSQTDWPFGWSAKQAKRSNHDPA